MLSNPVYRGCIQHREKLYEGAHAAIVDDVLWAAVQDRLAENTREKPSTPKISTPPILQGRLLDDRGHAMPVVHTKKGNTRYRYYASVALNPSKPREPGSVPRIAVGVLDTFVVRQLVPRLRSGWMPGVSSEERIRSAVAQLVLSDDQITITASADALQSDFAIPSGRSKKEGDQIEITIGTRLKHRKGSMQIECADGAAVPGQVDKALVRAVCLTRAWAEGLARGEYKTVTEVAERFGYWDHHVANLMPLAWLAPDLVEDILDGRQPAGLTLSKLIKRQLPMDWEAQRALFRNSDLRH